MTLMIPCTEVAEHQCLLEGKVRNSEPPMLTVFLHSIKLKLTKLDFCRAVLFLLFCSWTEVTKQLLFWPQCQVVPGGGAQLSPAQTSWGQSQSPSGLMSLTCSKGGREKQQQQHQVQTH